MNKIMMTLGFTSALLIGGYTMATAIENTDAAPVVEENTEENVYEIVIKDHVFNPETLEIPAGKKVKLVIINQDPTPEEFESHELKREKIIQGNGKGIVFVGPLEPGSYSYFGEFNMDTAKGTIVAK